VGALRPTEFTLPKNDLEHVCSTVGASWNELKNQTIFITGGTGFFGMWLLETFVWATEHLELNAKAVVLSRHPELFRQKAPHLALHPAIRLHAGDVCSFEYPSTEFSHVLHAAATTGSRLSEEDPLLMFDSIVDGTHRVLEFARKCGTKKFLLTSSGAVYGTQPFALTHIPEDYLGGPNQLSPRSAYGEGKRAAEELCALYAKQIGLSAKIARCFAFVGPYLPLDAHFAIGNFIRNSLQGESIQVKGDGTPYRSYLYAADLAIWLWTILFKGESGVAYNVGSDQALTILELAGIVAGLSNPPLKVVVGRSAVPNKLLERYVPSIDKAKQDLKLKVCVGLSEAIQRTMEFHKQYSSASKQAVPRTGR
jgi:dTDP-glucose 4,6-dehydratase